MTDNCGTQVGWQMQNRTCIDGNFDIAAHICTKDDCERKVPCNYTEKCPSTSRTGYI